MGQEPSTQAQSTSARDIGTLPQDSSVSIALVSEPYLGFPVKLRVTRSGLVNKSDYVRVMESTYHWMSNAPSDNIFTFPPVEPRQAGQDEPLTVVYYTNGGYLSKGNALHGVRFTMRNPLRSFDVVLTSGSPQSLVCTATLLAVAPTARITLLSGGVRLDEAALDSSTRQNGAARGESAHRVTLRAPRVGGTYTVSILGDRIGNSALDSKEMRVTAGSAYEVFFLAPSSALHVGSNGVTGERGLATKACMVAPGTSLRVRCTGPVQSGDVVLLAQPDASVRDLQAISRRFPVNAATAEVIITVPPSDDGGQDEGVTVWDVVLGLVHPTGAVVAGARASLAVSTGAAALAAPPPQPPQPQAPSPPPSAPSSAAAPTSAVNAGSTDTRFLCVICYDAVAVMKLEPCCHVCMCESCWTSLLQRASGNISSTSVERRCPMCRADITGSERVYLM